MDTKLSAPQTGMGHPSSASCSNSSEQIREHGRAWTVTPKGAAKFPSAEQDYFSPFQRAVGLPEGRKTAYKVMRTGWRMSQTLRPTPLSSINLHRPLLG